MSSYKNAEEEEEEGSVGLRILRDFGSDNEDLAQSD